MFENLGPPPSDSAATENVVNKVTANRPLILTRIRQVLLHAETSLQLLNQELEPGAPRPPSLKATLNDGLEGLREHLNDAEGYRDDVSSNISNLEWELDRAREQLDIAHEHLNQEVDRSPALHTLTAWQNSNGETLLKDVSALLKDFQSLEVSPAQAQALEAFNKDLDSTNHETTLIKEVRELKKVVANYQEVFKISPDEVAALLTSRRSP